MNRFLLVILSAANSLLLVAQDSDGSKIIKTSKGDCHMSMPADWEFLSGLTNMASGPKKVGNAAVSYLPSRQMTPLIAEAQKALGVTKLIENSSSRVLYLIKRPSGPVPMWDYFEKIPRNGGICVGQISVGAEITEDTVKKIASSLR